jgi:F0F1-type ATP synthase assembly protein I
MRAYTQSAAVTQLRTGLLLEVVFGVRATIAGCDAAVGNVTTVLPTTTFFSSVLWTTGPCYWYQRSAGEGLFIIISH